jgi:hypothetical protein
MFIDLSRIESPQLHQERNMAPPKEFVGESRGAAKCL